MTVFRVFWAMFLAGMLGFAFHRAWGWEHGKPSNKGIIFDVATGKETIVWVPPTYLIWGMMFTLAFLMFIRGISEGVIHFAAIMLDIILTFSVYFLLLLAFLPLLRKKISARACAVLWVIPVFMFYNVIQLLNTMPLPKLTLYFPKSVFKMLLLVWLTGFLAVEGYYLFSHMLFCRRVKKNARPVTDAERA